MAVSLTSFSDINVNIIVHFVYVNWTRPTASSSDFGSPRNFSRPIISKLDKHVEHPKTVQS